MLIASSVFRTFAKGHGMLTFPVARQMLLSPNNGVGLRNPGQGECDIGDGGGRNMNGCQGGVTYNPCHEKCNGMVDSDECVECRRGLEGLSPDPRLGVCGGLSDVDVFAEGEGCSDVGTRDPSCVQQALNAQYSEIELDAHNSFELVMTITAHHYGWSEFRLCNEGAGVGVTQECFNKHVLTFDVEDAKTRYPQEKMYSSSRPTGQLEQQFQPQSPSDYQGIAPGTRCDGPGPEITEQYKLEFPDLWSPRGSCCWDGGDCKDSNVSTEQNIRWVLPNVAAANETAQPIDEVPGAAPMHGTYTVKLHLPSNVRSICSRESGPCTIQWLYMTGNSRDSYPEAFRNCADFTVKEASRSQLRR